MGLFGGTQIETNKRNLVRNVIAWIGFNRTTDSNKIEVIVLDDQKSRELRRIRTTCSAVYLYDVVNKGAYTWMDMAKWGTNGWEIEETTSHRLHKAREFCSLWYRLRKGMKKKRNYYRTGYSFLVTQPGTNPEYQGSTLLSGRHVVLSWWYSDSERILFLFLRWEKVTKREKITGIGWENKRKKWEECFGDRTKQYFNVLTHKLWKISILEKVSCHWIPIQTL